jgi:hypothetical protein
MTEKQQKDVLAVAAASMGYIAALNSTHDPDGKPHRVAVSMGILNARLRIIFPQNFNENGTCKDMEG